MKFAKAWDFATDGYRIRRNGWNASGQFVAVQRPDALSKMSAPYAYLKNSQDELVPWVPSQGDLFASDWIVAAREN